MSIDILYRGIAAIEANTPRNNKFGDGNVDSLTEAIAAARAEHARVGGEPELVNNEDVVIVANGDNLWNLWKAHGDGASWDEFLDSNKHLRDPRDLGGAEQAGWNDYWLVHEGDVVFIPGEPATVTAGDKSGRLVKDGGTWKFEVFDDITGKITRHEVKNINEETGHYQILTHDGHHYAILKVEGDEVTVELLNPDKSRDTSDPKTQTFNMNDL